jgi:F-type H+-transporting ATPase subunit delta
MSETSSGAEPGQPVVSDDTVQLARRYARAVVDAGDAAGGALAVLDELTEIETDILEPYPRFQALLASTRVSVEEKDRILVELLSGRASDLSVRFLRVLNRHGRLAIFGIIVREARLLWDRRNKRVPVRVRSAVPLSEGQLQTLTERLATMVAGTPILEISTDPGIIGGLVVQVGDQLYDASVKSRLGQLRHRLIEGKIHEIQSRRDQFSHSA